MALLPLAAMLLLLGSQAIQHLGHLELELFALLGVGLVISLLGLSRLWSVAVLRGHNERTAMLPG